MKRMTDRTLCIGLVLSLATLTGALVTLNDITVTQRAEGVARELYQNARTRHEETVGTLERIAEEASTLDQWKNVLATAATLPAGAKEHFTARATIGMLEAFAAERDRLLVNAGELYASNEKDPDIRVTLDKARLAHEQAEALIQQLSASAHNPAWSLAFQYRKAYEKYRSLAFIDEKEHDKALDIIEDVMSNLRLANTAEPKNNRVELFIEFVYKKAKEEEKARGGSRASGRPRALPPRSPQDGPGTGGADRLRRH